MPSSRKHRRHRDRESEKFLKKLRKLKRKYKRRTRRSRSRTTSSSRSSSDSSSSDGKASRDRSPNNTPRRSRSFTPQKSRSGSPQGNRRRLDISSSPERDKSKIRGARSRSPITKAHAGERSPRGTSRHKNGSAASRSRSRERSPREERRHKDGRRGTRSNSGERSPRGASRLERCVLKDGDRSPRGTTPHDSENASPKDKAENANDFIELLGSDDFDEAADGPPMHATIAEKWQKILKLGLPKDSKEKLLKKFPIPQNCQTLKAPVLNPEVKSILGVGRKKDYYQALSQNRLGAAIGILGKALSYILSKEKSDDMATVFENISDAAKLLTDMHHRISMTRRFFILPALDFTGKSIAEESPIDTKLFGETFSEKLKSAKDVQRSAKEIARPNTFKGKKKNSGSTRPDSNSAKTSAKQNPSPSLNGRRPPRNNNQTNSRQEGAQKNQDTRNYSRRRHYSK